MPIDRVVINASPLIILFKSQFEHLLAQLFAEIIIPGAVWDEVVSDNVTDLAAQKLPTVSWARRVEVSSVDPAIMGWDLGRGESEVLTFAMNNAGFRAMVDDGTARRCARTLNIPILGTGGLLVLAKRNKLINSVSLSIEILRDSGLWISTEIVNLLKQAAGE